jgi:hypothetical protein
MIIYDDSVQQCVAATLVVTGADKPIRGFKSKTFEEYMRNYSNKYLLIEDSSSGGVMHNMAKALNICASIGWKVDKYSFGGDFRRMYANAILIRE